MRNLVPRKVNTAISVAAVALLSGCFTSPEWDYEPDSITAQMPFQVWTTSASSPVKIECATDTGGHGNPTNGDASYITAANLWPDTHPHYDGFGSIMYSASTMMALPNSCWKYFSAYDFWQANIRMSQLVSGEQRIFSSFDRTGLECLGRENGKEHSWMGYLTKGCEKTYLGSSTIIPYIVLRIDGYSNGLNGASAGVQAVDAKVNASLSPPPADAMPKNMSEISQIQSFDVAQLRQIQSAAKRGLNAAQIQQSLETSDRQR